MLTGALAFLLLLLALLAIPVTLSFQVSWRQAVQNNIELQWAFGFVRVRIPPSQPTAEEASPEDEEVEQRIGRLQRYSDKKHDVFAVVRQKKFRQRMMRFISDVWHAVHKKNVKLRVRLGLGDPADTGQLWAILGPIAGILASIREVSIKIEPEFLDTAFELDSSGSIRIIPLQMIYLTAALLLSPPVWQGIKQLRLMGR